MFQGGYATNIIPSAQLTTSPATETLHQTATPSLTTPYLTGETVAPVAAVLGGVCPLIAAIDGGRLAEEKGCLAGARTGDRSIVAGINGNAPGRQESTGDTESTGLVQRPSLHHGEMTDNATLYQLEHTAVLTAAEFDLPRAATIDTRVSPEAVYASPTTNSIQRDSSGTVVQCKERRHSARVKQQLSLESRHCAASKQRQLKFFQTVNHAEVIWNPNSKPKGGQLNVRSIIRSIKCQKSVT